MVARRPIIRSASFAPVELDGSAKTMLKYSKRKVTVRKGKIMPKRKPATPARTTHRAAIYLRVSTDDQASDGYGLDVQRQQCEAYASAFGLTIVATYSDDGVSGTKPASERPALAHAIADAQAGKLDVLIFAAIDRLARKASLLLALWDSFEAAGIAIVAVRERVDTSTPVGRLMRTMIAAIAEFDRDSIVERTTAGRDERGKVDGDKGGRVPLGYTRTPDGAIVIDPQAAAVVRRIFAARQMKTTLKRIANELNADGIAPARQRQQRYSGAKWYASTVQSVLHNEKAYKGGKRGQSPVRWPAILN